MKNVKEIKVSSIDELKEVLDGITEDVIAQIEEDKKRVHTPFYITLDVAHIIEEKFIPVPDEGPDEVEAPKEELPGYKRRLKIEYKQLKRRYNRPEEDIPGQHGWHSGV